MKKLLAFLFASVLASSAAQAGLPSKGVYQFYEEGYPCGTDSFTVEKTRRGWKVRSWTRADCANNYRELECTVLFDPETWFPVEVEYRGLESSRGDMSGELSFHEDTLVGVIRTGEKAEYGSKYFGTDRPIFFEDYVPVLLQTAANLVPDRVGPDVPSATYPWFVTSYFYAIEATVKYVGEGAVETGKDTRVCYMIALAPTGASPFLVYVDKELGFPIYMDFPVSRTEVLYAPLFSSNPPLKYRSN
jgi:hypothetical protein